jgi:hypothetical protein
MWKKIGIVLLVAVLGLVGFIASRPADFSISRSQKIHAPPGVVYMFVYDFRNWQRWSPWEKLDPDMKKTFSGPEKGEGASYSWVGNDQVGEGRMTIEKAINSRQLEIRLEFLKPFATTNQTVFTFDKNGPDTVVKWTMAGKNDFVGKAFSAVMDMDAMVGKDFETGLEALRRAAEGEVKRQAEEQARLEGEVQKRLAEAAAKAAAEAAKAAADSAGTATAP